MPDFDEGNPALTQSAKQIALLVTFTWTDSSAKTVRFTDWTENIIDSSQTFTSLTPLSVKLPRQEGGVRDGRCVISMPASLQPGSFLSNGEKAPLVSVTVEETMWKSVIARRILFVGYCTRAKLVTSRELTELEFSTTKSKLEVPLGLPVIAECPWRFGDTTCGINLEAIKDLATITDVDGRFLTVSGLANNTDVGRYHRGFVQKDGVRIGIRAYKIANRIELFERPPASWEGSNVYVYPGCDKLPVTCLIRWQNIEQFGGMGWKMPARHPIFDIPTTSLGS